MAKLKKKLKIKNETIFSSESKILYSGTTLTDLKNFAEFNVEKPPNIPDVELIKFRFKNGIDEKNIQFSLDQEVKPIVKGEMVYFGERVVNIQFYNYFIKKYLNIKFYWFDKFMDRLAMDNIAVVKNGGLIGYLRTFNKEEI
ncbi:MAG: hypothetical protein RBR32_03635 [Bacteroidales bacterium]|nr:hypothetical protein [Bacteroidales bacterium]